MIIGERDKSHYIIDTEVRNEGIKYADAFFVASRYCLVQTGANKSHLKVTCEVRYVKSLMIIIKCKKSISLSLSLCSMFVSLVCSFHREEYHSSSSRFVQ